MTSQSPEACGRVNGVLVDHYGAYLMERDRPPSKGGNTGAMHAHVLTIDGQKYSFLAVGTNKWVFKADTVSFDYSVKGKYRNIDKASLRAVDQHGRPVHRGNRWYKRVLRQGGIRRI